MDWKTTIITSAQNSVATLDQAIAELSRYRDSATAEIAKHSFARGCFEGDRA
jgi:hypothetical protein